MSVACRNIRYDACKAKDKEKVKLNCKGPKLDDISMSRKELEIPIDNPGAMEEILGELDFFPVHCRVKKKRYDFSCEKITASLDRVEGFCRKNIMKNR